MTPLSGLMPPCASLDPEASASPIVEVSYCSPPPVNLPALVERGEGIALSRGMPGRAKRRGTARSEGLEDKFSSSEGGRL